MKVLSKIWYSGICLAVGRGVDRKSELYKTNRLTVRSLENLLRTRELPFWVQAVSKRKKYKKIASASHPYFLSKPNSANFSIQHEYHRI